MIIIIEKTVLETMIEKDPDATDVCFEFWPGVVLSLASAGTTGETLDGDGNEVTPFTHYVWGDRRINDLDALQEFSLAAETIVAGPKRRRPNLDTETDTARESRLEKARERAEAAGQCAGREQRCVGREAAARALNKGRKADFDDDRLPVRRELELQVANETGHLGVRMVDRLDG